MVASYKKALQYQYQETDIGAKQVTRPQTLFSFTDFYTHSFIGMHVLFYSILPHVRCQ